MKNKAAIALAGAVSFFLIFLLNLLAGALFGTRLLSDVAEMLTLFASSISFVIAVLLIEKAANLSGDE